MHRLRRGIPPDAQDQATISRQYKGRSRKYQDGPFSCAGTRSGGEMGISWNPVRQGWELSPTCSGRGYGSMPWSRNSPRTRRFLFPGADPIAGSRTGPTTQPLACVQGTVAGPHLDLQPVAVEVNRQDARHGASTGEFPAARR